MKKYDAIVIGAGNGGLFSALSLQKNGKKVLLLEKNRQPGGISTSFKKGRFEFDVNEQMLSNYGNLSHPGELYQLFEKFHLNEKVKTIACHDVFHLHVKDTQENFIFPKGQEAFIEQMEKYVPGSKEAMVTFFGLCEDVREAISHYPKEKPSDMDIFYQTYPNFVELAPYKVIPVLEKIHLPKKAIQILSSFWVFFGSFIEDISFIHFALLVDSYVTYGLEMLEYTSYDLSTLIAHEFLALGGEIRYSSCVDEILTSDQKVTGVKVGNEEFSAPYVVADISPAVVYGKMILKENVPSSSCQLSNERILGAREFRVFLGLNQSLEFAPMVHVIVPTLNQKVLHKNQNSIFPDVLMGVVKNNHDSSSILELGGYFFQDRFDRIVKKENYYALKEELASMMIDLWESVTHLSIKPFIEEIAIATPVTFARYTNHPDGTTYGYLAKGYDNLLPRLFTKDKERKISGLYFCGSFGNFLSGFSATYFSGSEVAKEILEEKE